MERTCRLEIRVSPKEKKRFKDLANKANMDTSSYIRFCVLSSEERLLIVDSQEIRNGFTQIKRIGNNINQIARELNTYHSPPNVIADLEKTLFLLNQASDSCLEFMQSIYRK